MRQRDQRQEKQATWRNKKIGLGCIDADSCDLSFIRKRLTIFTRLDMLLQVSDLLSLLRARDPSKDMSQMFLRLSERTFCAKKNMGYI